METKDMLYLVSEYASQGEIFGKNSTFSICISFVVAGYN